MKWTKELDEELKKLVSLGKKYEEISIELNTSIRSITNRSFRLGLNLVFYKDCNCKKCDKIFTKRIKSQTKFCSSSCACSYNNEKRGPRSDETKKKISESVKKTRPKRINVKKKRYCKNCTNEVINKKTICDDCRIDYYDYYRPSCEFEFDIKLYKDKFDFKLVEQYGWYSPSNKGNNLNGVSRDHMYCVRDGFINKIDPEIIKHPANCNLMKHTDNNTKHYNSSITLDELLEKINNWDKKY